MRKMLMLTSVPSMIGAFNMDNIDMLMEKGYEVHVACDFSDRSVWSGEKIQQLMEDLRDRNIPCHQIDFTRRVSDFKRHIKAYRQVDKLLEKEKFDFIHCHAPIASIVARCAAKKHSCKVIYTAHGFHFYKGAPLQNWIFYPVEKHFSRYTDVLITINAGDYQIARSRFKAKKVAKIPGVGLDNRAIYQKAVNKAQKRKELNIPKDAFVILSVGNLYPIKNQDVIIRAVAKINDKGIYYLIAGEGEKKQEYHELINKYGMSENIILLGYREDVSELCYASDVFAQPSKREGLGMAALEAMATGLPVITSNVGGINSYSKNGKTGYKYAPDDENGFAGGIRRLKNNPELRRKMGEYNRKVAKRFDISITKRIMSKIYDDI